MRTSRRIALVVLLIFVASLAALLLTTSGLRLTVKLLQAAVPGTLEVEVVAGRLLGPIEIQGLSYRQPDGLQLSVPRGVVNWQPGALFEPRVVVSDIRIQSLSLRLPPATESEHGGTAPTDIPALDTPVPLELRAVSLSDARIESAQGQTIAEIHRASATVSWQQATLDIEHFKVQERRGQIRLRGSLDSAGPHGLRLHGGWQSAAVHQMPPTAGSLEVHGDIDHLSAVVRLRAPAQAEAQLELRDLAKAFNWQARIRADAFPLQQLRKQWPAWQLATHITAQGGRDELRADTRIDLARQPSGAETITINTAVEVTGLTRTPTWRMTLDTMPLEGQSVHPSLPEDLQVVGRLVAQGEGQTLQADVSIDLTADQQAYRIGGAISGAAPNWRLQRLTLEDSNSPARLNVSGKLQTAPQPAFELQGSWQSLTWPLTGAPSLRSPAGRFSAQGGSTKLNGHIEGELEDVRVSGTITRDNTVWRLESFQARQNDAPGHAELAGRVTLTDPLDVDIEGHWQDVQWPQWQSPTGKLSIQGSGDDFIVDIGSALALPDDDGRFGAAAPLQLRAKIQGLPDHPRTNGKITLPYFDGGGLSLHDLNASWALDSGDRTPSSVTVEVADLRVGDLDVGTLRLSGEGLAARHEVTLATQGQDFRLQTDISAAWSDDTWRGQLTQMDFNSARHGEWRSDGTADFNAAAEGGGIAGFCIAGHNSRVCADGQWRRDAPWQLRAKLEALPMSLLAPWLDSGLDWAGRLSGDLAITAGDKGMILGTGQLTSPAGRVSWQREDEPGVINYRGLSLGFEGQPEHLNLRWSGKIEEQGRLAGEVSLSQGTDQGSGPRDLGGQLHLELPDLKVLQPLLPQAQILAGNLLLDGQVAGTLSMPRIEAQAQLEDGRLMWPDLGIELSDLNLRADMDRPDQIALSGRTRSGEGTLRVDGNIELGEPVPWRANLELAGERLQVANLPQARIVASSDLSLSADASGTDIRGVVRIDEAQIEPQLSDPAVELSPDVVIVSEDSPQAPASATALDADIRLELGERTRFEGYGLTAALRGELRVIERPDLITLATGEITLADGKYEIYGQNLDIDRGRLVFAGSAIDNPGLEARAVREVGDVTSGVKLSGTVQEPRLELFSNPELPDADKLSYLLLGQPAYQASNTESSLLFNAATALLPGEQGALKARLQTALGLDTLDFRSATAEDEGAAVVLGKYLSPKLYISYAAGIADALNVFKVRYQLTRNLLLQTESSSRESGGDLLYIIER